MVAGIASPTPSGIPGFNESFVQQAGVGGGAFNAVPLRSWYNVVASVLSAGDSVMLPPTAGAEPILVVNNSGRFPNTTANSCTVFGNVNAAGQQDTIANATGVQGVLGTAVPANSVAMFYPLTIQTGFSNNMTVGSWQFKILT